MPALFSKTVAQFAQVNWLESAIAQRGQENTKVRSAMLLHHDQEMIAPFPKRIPLAGPVVQALQNVYRCGMTFGKPNHVGWWDKETEGAQADGLESR